ncbi:MAG TPA: Asp-tRNA(Asn)/Glu-tRNA(Gln) amidotransferase subunit GatB [Patescibacteria group bacterium]|nr:Asp-tRNA(Asn)/Glu-tRNA(Gln) amidotransferase subunit GatB [Patescibacteria group bacterium]
MSENQYTPTIGLEIHVQLKTKSKMFCRCANTSAQIGVSELKPNSHICPVCTGQPGALPAINAEAVKLVVKTGLALECIIAKHSKFDRKNYFYPDLPKGYQISQYDQPLCTNGILIFGHSRIGIERIHLEEDTGRLIHDQSETDSLVDLNRAGIPLMELVTKPDIHSAAEAKEFCQELQKILRQLDISDADMEKSQMRCEVNISLSATHKLGTKVEIKNLNSFKAVERSIEYEIMRQTKLLEAGEKIIQETRGWNDREQTTYSQRSKEDAHDYRYFPEPDLPPINLTDEEIKKIEQELPELPQAKVARFMEQYDFSLLDAKQIVSDKRLADFTEQTMSELQSWLVDLDEVELENADPWEKYRGKLSKLVANWLINKLPPLLTGKEKTFETLPLTPENFAEFITLIYKNKINSKNALQILEQMVESGGDPTSILEDQGLHLLEDVSDIDPVVDKVIADNPEQVEQFKKGKTAVMQFLIGQVMKETKGRVNPKMAEELLIQKLT